MTKKYLMVIANYPDERQDFFEKYMSPRNKEYAKLHNFEYLEYKENLKLIRDNPTWWKFSIVKDLIDSDVLKENDIITHLDADMCIVKPEYELKSSKSFTYVIDSGNTHCMGCYSMRINEWSKNTIDLILDEDRYQKLLKVDTVHDYFGYTNSFVSDFREQAVWYSLAGIKRHSDIPFWDLKDYGWHSAFNEFTHFSIDDLYKNVEILPTKWNVTEMVGESHMLFNINKTHHNDVIIRHFASRQPWRKEWFQNTNTIKFRLLHTFPINYIRKFIEPYLRKLKRKYIKS
jgi:hypothetical protein